MPALLVCTAGQGSSLGNNRPAEGGVRAGAKVALRLVALRQLACVSCAGMHTHTPSGAVVCVYVCVLSTVACVWGRKVGNPSLREPMKESESGGAKTTGLPSLLLLPLPRYLLYPGCQVAAAQQNKAKRGQTRASAFSTNEGVLPCADECVQVFACTHQPVIHYACSQTSFRFRLRQNSGELCVCVCVCVCVRADLRVCAFVCVSAKLWRLLSSAAICQGDSNWLQLLQQYPTPGNWVFSVALTRVAACETAVCFYFYNVFNLLQIRLCFLAVSCCANEKCLILTLTAMKLERKKKTKNKNLCTREVCKSVSFTGWIKMLCSLRLFLQQFMLQNCYIGLWVGAGQLFKYS